LPLRALSFSENINAFELNDSDWDILKKTYKNLELKLPCCHAEAIPKTSKLGNFFFAHKTRDVCTTAPESAEHIFLKSIIAKAAANAGWTVTTEFPGQSDDGEQWIADVYCEKGKAKVAIEVQLSYITYETLKFRTEKYQKSNVRPAWFLLNTKFANYYSEQSKSVPFFKLNKFIPGEIPFVEDFGIPVNVFVDNLLNKKVQWVKTPWDYEFLYVEDTCWRCKKDVKQVYGYSIDVYYEVAKTVPNASTVLFGILDIISNDELKGLGLNYIGQFEHLKGNAPGFPYCNVCIHCDAPQNNHYLMERRKMQDHKLGNEKFVSIIDDRGSWKIAL